MKSTAFPEILNEAGEVKLAVFTTYGFEPLFFEECLLRTKGLAGASRIVVMADEAELQRQATSTRKPPRWFNQRYLVAPMRVARGGVFHPKVALLLGEKEATLIVGSANLTAAGCTRNLELINVLRFSLETNDPDPNIGLVDDALRFFHACLQCTSPGIREIMGDWIPEAKVTQSSPLKLVHTLDGPLWPLIDKADAVKVLSPFYDTDLRLVRRLKEQIPKASITLIAQQHTSLLPVAELDRLKKGVRLQELRGESNRLLHAKFCIIESGRRVKIIAGSANFTEAAFDGRNVEACLVWEDDVNAWNSLFGRGLSVRDIEPEDFVPGMELAPEDVETRSTDCLRIRSARLNDNGLLTIDFEPPEGSLGDLAAEIFDPSQGQEPVACPKLRLKAIGIIEANLQTVPFSGGAIQVRLCSGDLTGQPAWIIQEASLTRVFENNGGFSPKEMLIQESGEGLAEYLDHLAAAKGLEAVIAYLENLNIRFQTDRSRVGGRGRYTLNAHDPHKPDDAADWMRSDALSSETKDRLRLAVLEFIERHEKRVLHAHARNPTLNGVANLLDVLRACVRLLYLYWERNCLNRHDVVHHCKRCLQLLGEGLEDEESYGFLAELKERFHGSLNTARDSLISHQFFSSAWTVLLIARRVRADLSRMSGKSPERLDSLRQPLLKAFGLLQASTPSREETAAALEEFRLLSETERLIWAVGA